MGIILLIPIGIALIVFLGFIGFTLDFGNVWNGHTNSMYMFLLPFGFIAIIGWAIYSLSKRRSAIKAKNQETKIRQQVYQEQELGTNIEDGVVNVLARDGSKTAEELSQMLNVDKEQMFEIIRKLLESGSIGQDASLLPSRYYILPRDDENPSELS
ncbi:MAG: hypothetical protein JWP13_935 [Candidatus Saccharibacteria bacterium]|nr:hypothetical protein [Candidatus Saccharibacteria bacterium]